MLAHARRLLNVGAPAQALVAYRASVALAVLVAIGAVASQGAVSLGFGVLAAALVPAGFVLSYARRHHRNILLKVALAGALFVAFGAFLSSVRGAASVDDTRQPLATLFMWVLVLHSFDVPRRRDLAFSVGASVALIALAGSLAFSSAFLLWVLPYALAFLASLALGHDARLRERAGDGEAREVRADAAPGTRDRRPGASHLRPLAAVASMTLVCSFAVFVALPRFPGIRMATLPFSIAQDSPISNFAGEVVNPSGGATGSSSAARAFDPDAYFGYGERLDLRVRGRLSDELVMRVRSPEPHLWRAQAYDRYDGTAWSSSDTDLEQLSAGFDRSIAVPGSREGRSPFAHEVVQTFYVERELPNLVFHAADAQEVYTPSTSLRVDDHNSLRLPFTLQEDTIYSVVSRVPDLTVEDLRSAPPAAVDDPDLATYLQIPTTLSQRFHDLAHGISAGHPTTVDKVLAVEAWLRENKEYRLDIPRDPAGRDPVEVFLFERNEGFCEQIATSMALLLRAVGVPTRLVTGFGEGQRNLFTGYWEVRNSDAHAWVEVLYPGYGWVAYDPTFGVPVSSAANTTFMLEPLGRLAGSLVPATSLRGLASAVTDSAASIGTTLAAIALLAGAASLVVRRRRSRRVAGSTPAERIVTAWLRVEDALAARGAIRGPHETVREFASRVRADDGVDTAAFDRLVELFGRTRYGRRSPDAGDVGAADRLADEIVAQMKQTRLAAFSVRRG